jgi:hypothetical protein
MTIELCVVSFFNHFDIIVSKVKVKVTEIVDKYPYMALEDMPAFLNAF